MKRLFDSLEHEVDRVLWEVWDPLNVHDIGAPRDEYRSYVKPIALLIRSGASDSMIANHLLVLVREQMGLEAARFDDMLPTVRALREIK